MHFKSLIALGALLASAAAVPVQQLDKRAVAWTTEIDVVVTTVQVTTTVFVTPGQQTPAAQTPSPKTTAAQTAKASPQLGRNHREKKKKTSTSTSHIKSTVTVRPQSAKTHPVTTTTQAVATPPQTKPTSTTTAVAAPSQATASPASNNPPSAAQPANAESASPLSGYHYNGFLTYYTPGLGSCGYTNVSSEFVVAINEPQMKAAPNPSGNPNMNPYCGHMITIEWGSKTEQAMVVDTCPGCASDSLDLSPVLFGKFMPLSKGLIANAKWWFDT